MPWSGEGTDTLTGDLWWLVQTTRRHLTVLALFPRLVLRYGSILLRLHQLSKLSFARASLGTQRMKEVRVFAIPVTASLYVGLVPLLLTEIVF